MEQPQYNMLVREKVEKEFWGLYREHGLGLTIFSPLKMGILTGKYNDGLPEDSRLGLNTEGFVRGFNKTVGNEAWKAQIEIVKNLKPVADKLECSMAQLAIAWVLMNSNVSSAITGTSRPDQIYETVKAFDVKKKLAPEVMEEIEKILGNKPEEITMRFS